MKKSLEIRHVVVSSECDMAARIKLSNIADILQDAASIHAVELGVGHDSMLERYNAVWIVPRMKFRFKRLPTIPETLSIRTWPNRPKAVRGNRNYQIISGDEVIIECRAEWSILNADTRSIIRLDRTDYALSADFPDDVCCPEPFLPLGDELSDEDFVYTHRVAYSDIDMSYHVNNAVYIRLLTDAIPPDFLSGMKCGEFEIRYMHECRLGDEISIYAKRTQDGWQLHGRRSDGVPAVFALLRAQTDS